MSTAVVRHGHAVAGGFGPGFLIGGQLGVQGFADERILAAARGVQALGGRDVGPQGLRPGQGLGFRGQRLHALGAGFDFVLHCAKDIGNSRRQRRSDGKTDAERAIHVSLRSDPCL